MIITVYSDIVCPFCYIGKRQLEKALAQFEHADEVKVEYRSFELNHDAATESSENLHDYLAKHKGISKEDAKRMNQQVSAYAAQVGLHYDMEHAHPANSFNAHRLVHLAAKHGLSGEMVEKLHSSYFVEGKNIGQIQDLVNVAVSVGLDKKEAETMLSSDTYGADVRADEAEAKRLGVTGVPFFSFGFGMSLVGAQPSEVFLETLQKVWMLSQK